MVKRVGSGKPKPILRIAHSQSCKANIPKLQYTPRNTPVLHGLKFKALYQKGFLLLNLSGSTNSFIQKWTEENSARFTTLGHQNRSQWQRLQEQKRVSKHHRSRAAMRNPRKPSKKPRKPRGIFPLKQETFF